MSTRKHQGAAATGPGAPLLSPPGMVMGEVIAHGATAAVRRARSASTQQDFAVKIIYSGGPEAGSQARKEAKLHKLLLHKNIIRLHSVFVSDEFTYLVLDYAHGHELFSYIEPGAGMMESLCHLYLKQLHSALAYIHSKGVCHRDVKPENLLLDKNLNLLLADFGCATVYRDASGRRTLTRHSGSPNYMAPEIFYEEYDGEEVDVWSFGMVALIMFTGVVPWAKPFMDDPEFEVYRHTKHRDYPPFSSLPREKRAFVESLLSIERPARPRLGEIGRNPWMAKKSIFMDPDGMVRSTDLVREALMRPQAPAFSQPGECISPPEWEYSSQPVFLTYDDAPIATRIYCSGPPKTALSLLWEVLEELLIQHKISGSAASLNTVDGRKNPICGEIFCRSVGNESCLIFKRTRGDCIEFKRMFNAVKEKFNQMASASARGRH